MRGKEYLCATVAERGILRAETLRFADEVRSPETIGLPTKALADTAAVARFSKAIKALKVTALDRTELEDQHSASIVALAEKKLRSGTDVVPASASGEEVQESPTNVVDLLEVLRERLRGKLHARAGPVRGSRKRTGMPVGKLMASSKSALYQLAQSMDIPGRSAMTKAQLIKALAHQRPV